MNLSFHIQAIDKRIIKKVSLLSKLFEVTMELLAENEYKNIEINGFFYEGKVIECINEIYKIIGLDFMEDNEKNDNKNIIHEISVDSKINENLIRPMHLTYDKYNKNRIRMVIKVGYEDIGKIIPIFSFKDWDNNIYYEFGKSISYTKINDKLEDEGFKPSKAGEYFIEVAFNQKLTTCKYMFNNCTKITILDMSRFDFSCVTDMHGMFSNCRNLKNLDIFDIDTKNVIDMEAMFYNCRELNKIPNISQFNTDKCTNFAYMFSYCKNIKELNLENFNFNKVINTKNISVGCDKSLKIKLKTSNIPKDLDFNKSFPEIPENNIELI